MGFFAYHSYMDEAKRILITRKLPEAAGALLKSAGHRVTQWDHGRDMTKDELRWWAKGHDAILTVGGNVIDEDFMDACPSIRMISLFAVGYDNIDISAATKRGIPVGFTPDSVTHATADVAFLLMQAVSRKMIFQYRRILNGEWRQFEPTGHLGTELRGKTLGVYGLGRIGMEMARRCTGAFGMTVIYHNRNRNAKAEAALPARWVTMDELLSQSDVLSVHCPLNTETRLRFAREEFRRMKRSAIFINTSRGGVHDEPALLEALQNGWIWGAGLDVTNPEPMAADNPLLFMENVVILPHIGSGTSETRDHMANTAAQNIIRFFQSGEVPACVNPQVLKNPSIHG